MRARNVTSLTPSGGAAAGQTVELAVGEAAHGGWCVARMPAGDGGAPGRVVFVRHALPGERVRARITETTSRFARADAVEILEASPDRVEPPCPYARPGRCGGCDWQHASLPAQRRLKASVLRQQLNRIAGLDWPVTVEPLPGDEEPGASAGGGASAGPAGLGWRTRVTFAVREDGVAGLRAHRSHEVVGIDDCLIAHPGLRDLGVTRRTWPRATAVEAVVATGSGERAVITSGRVNSAQLKGIAAETVLAVPGRRGRGSGGGGATVVRGRTYLRQRAAGRSWRVGATGFWQVHPGAADTLASVVLEALRPAPGDTALDLYCGAGLFAGVLAAAVGPGGTVIGVEASPSAVRDARRNLRDTPWATVIAGDAAEVLARHDLPPARLAVLDPPRTGASREVIDYLAGGGGAAGGRGQGGERRVVAYVSCDPATLARDIALFTGRGWRLEDLRAFDAFPMTHHMECVATLVAGGAQPDGS
jgi:tRNA/tmRNA/rRNA uracil-C5-methylase (TrmA/RlmC/RlmD family)